MRVNCTSRSHGRGMHWNIVDLLLVSRTCNARPGNRSLTQGSTGPVASVWDAGCCVARVSDRSGECQWGEEYVK